MPLMLVTPSAPGPCEKSQHIPLILSLSETLFQASFPPCRSNEPGTAGGSSQQLPNRTFLDRPPHPRQGHLESSLSSVASMWLATCVGLASGARAGLALVPGWAPAALGREGGRPSSSSTICSGTNSSIPPRDVLMLQPACRDRLINDSHCHLTGLGPPVGHLPWPKAEHSRRGCLSGACQLALGVGQ